MSRWINPIIAVQDNALELFEGFRAEVQALPFGEAVALDGVVYPEVAILPKHLEDAFLAAIKREMGPIVPRHVFARRMPAGVKVPNRIHTDLGFGVGSVILYLTAPPHSGTQFWNHATLGQGLTQPAEFNTQVDESWTRGVFVPAVPNRLLLHAANFFHSAEPTKGAGRGKNARLVITCFFDLASPRN